jgi:hypothetical protein
LQANGSNKKAKLSNVFLVLDNKKRVLCGFGPVSHIKEINNFIVNQQPEPSGGNSLKN